MVNVKKTISHDGKVTGEGGYYSWLTGVQTATAIESNVDEYQKY